jgi:hypothetical protein
MKLFTQISCLFTKSFRTKEDSGRIITVYCGGNPDGRKLGRCLVNALALIDKRPDLKLVQGPPGRNEDTSHFWTVDPSGEVVDPTPDVVPEDYPYEGRIVDPESVKRELGIA